jgi:hypothetical protein
VALAEALRVASLEYVAVAVGPLEKELVEVAVRLLVAVLDAVGEEGAMATPRNSTPAFASARTLQVSAAKS